MDHQNIPVARQFNKGDSSAGFGFRSLDLIGPAGSMMITALREFDDDCIVIVDWNALKLAGSHFFDRKRHGGNEEYFMVRAEAGYSYIVDVRLFGNLIVQNPSYCGIIFGISY